MSRVLIVLCGLMALLMAATVFAYKTFGMAGVLGLAVVGAVSLKLLGKLVKHAIVSKVKGLFEMKGNVLKNAKMSVHQIVDAPLPTRGSCGDCDCDADEDDSDDGELANKRWMYVDVTISPDPAVATGFTHWSPDELMVVKEDAREGLDFESDDTPDEETVGEVAEVLIWSEGDFAPADYSKFEGEQRVRLHIGVEPEVECFRLSYYGNLLPTIRVQ